MIGRIRNLFQCSSRLIFDRKSIFISLIVLFIIGFTFFSFSNHEKNKIKIKKKVFEEFVKNETRKIEEIHKEPEKIIHPEPPTHVDEEKIDKKIKYHTIIALGVVSRFKENKQIDYLSSAIESLHSEFKRFKNLKTKEKFLVYIQNNDKINRPIGYQKLKYDLKFKSNFKFKTVENRYKDPFKDIPGHDYQHPNNILPGIKC